ncbi:hypothetical protein M0P48_04460 [Candidatus Gracilibacteria bacterium]|jgi:hypothetical protein|nr:hypothetical protein [Candidatus Gracilibacteria bacterium]
MTHKKPQEDLPQEPLLQPGAIEALIEDGRIPLGFGILIEEGGKPQMSFWIPPKGTKLGDSMEGDGAFGFQFRSPEGQDRGHAEWHVVPKKIGEQIKTRVKAALKQLKN